MNVIQHKQNVRFYKQQVALVIPQPQCAWIGLLGFTAFRSIPRAEDPDFPVPIYTTIAVYPGASPEDMEQLVVEPIEKRLSKLEKIKSIESQSMDGVAVVRLEFESTVDADRKNDEVQREVNDGDVLADVMGGLQVIHVPGHAPGQIALWQPHWRVLICGDAMMNLPKLSLPLEAYTVDMQRARLTVQHLAKLNPTIVCFGHGSPIFLEAAEKIRAFASSITR